MVWAFDIYKLCILGEKMVFKTNEAFQLTKISIGEFVHAEHAQKEKRKSSDKSVFIVLVSVNRITTFNFYRLLVVNLELLVE